MIEDIELGDALELLVDNRGKNPPFEDFGIPLLSGKSLTDQGIDMAAVRFVSEGTYRRWMPRPIRKGDLVMTSEAPLGRVALVRTDSPVALGQRLFGMRGRVGVLDTRFLFYALKTSRVRADLSSRATGTTVLGIRQPELRKLRIPAPPYGQQLAIAEVLGALDDKIAANDVVCRIIDRLLRVEFERLVRGRGQAMLVDIATINNVAVKPHPGGVLRYIDIASVAQGAYEFPRESSWDDAPGRARRRVKTGDTIWSTVRPNRRSHALVLDDDPLLVASTGLAVLTPRIGRTAGLYEATQTDQFVGYLESVAEGSAYPAVRADKFGTAPIPALTADEWDHFEEFALPHRQRAHAASVETRKLAAMRDALLPLLMSGKVRVREAEKVVEGARNG